MVLPWPAIANQLKSRKSGHMWNCKSMCRLHYVNSIPNGSKLMATALPILSTRSDSPNCSPYLMKKGRLFERSPLVILNSFIRTPWTLTSSLLDASCCMLFAWFDALGKRHFSLPACCANSLSFFNDVSPKTRPTIVILKPNNNTDLLV